MDVALMMAGGRGERMLASRGPTPKPLVPVRGVPLIERNLAMLLMAGAREVVVAVPAGLPEIGRWVEGRGRALAAARGATVRCVVETVALGTIGAAAGLWGAAGALPADYAVPVVNADNLVALDLRGLVARHREAAAAFTVATHLQPFRIPFGEVEVVDGRLVAYHEKPDHPVRVSSGTYVLGPVALAALAPGERCDVPTLVTRLLGRGEVVAAYAHATPWIDVNDAASVARAEALVAAHPEAFERWASPPDRVVAGVVVRAGEEMLLEFRPASARCYPGLWDTPGGKVEAGEHPAAAAARELREELGLALDAAALRPVATFDDLDPASGEVFRHHVFAADVAREAVRAADGQRLVWVTPAAALALDRLSPAVVRSLAALEGAR